MTNKDLANLIFPDITKTIEDYDKEYPNRDLKEGAKVTRVAPSPTGFMHIGTFMSAMIDYVMAKNSGGVFMLRNEDTDQERIVEGAVDVIFKTFDAYNIVPDEYERDGKIVGNYGPYVQSERKEIYHAFLKHMIEIGRAYPCFCTKEETDAVAEIQKKEGLRTGYYGRYAKCRNLSIDEAYERIKNGENYILRFKSSGNFNKKFKFDDQKLGTIELPENDEDLVIMKASTKLPTYHFAHIVDDYLMKTTHVVRGEEWLSSVPKHIDMFNAFGFKPPKYVHTSLILKKDGDSVRKISKRKDSEALMTFYIEKGYPSKAVIDSVMTIANSNYEEWRTGHPDSPFTDFEFSPKKISKSGAFFDMDKLDNISKNIISRMTKDELFDELYKWATTYDVDFAKLIKENVDYTKSILNIEREQKKPRKDYAYYSEIKEKIWYMFDELYDSHEKNYEYQTINDEEEIEKIVKTYFEKYYDESDDKETWFNKIKDLSEEFGYAREVKAYKENPDGYKGHVGDISTAIRVRVTTCSMTPDLYEILKLLGKERILKRLK